MSLEIIECRKCNLLLLTKAYIRLYTSSVLLFRSYSHNWKLLYSRMNSLVLKLMPRKGLNCYKGFSRRFVPSYRRKDAIEILFWGNEVKKKEEHSCRLYLFNSTNQAIRRKRSRQRCFMHLNFFSKRNNL